MLKTQKMTILPPVFYSPNCPDRQPPREREGIFRNLSFFCGFRIKKIELVSGLRLVPKIAVTPFPFPGYFVKMRGIHLFFTSS